METEPANEFVPAKPKIVRHVIKAALFAAAALGVFMIPVGIVFSDKTSSDTAKFLAVLGGLLASWPMIAGLCRNIHAFKFRPHIILTRQGIRLRFWQPVIMNLGLFKPFYPAVERTIPWPEMNTARTYKHTVNGVPNWKSLIIETNDENYEIGWDIFALDVKRLQAAILDYIQMELRLPQREKMRVAKFCRDRFSKPVRLLSTAKCISAAVCFGAAAVSSGVIKLLVPKFPDTGWVMVPVVLAVIAFILLKDWLRGWKKRTLEFNGNGFAFGRAPENMLLVPWEDVLFARCVTENNVTESLEIRIRDRSSQPAYPNYPKAHTLSLYPDYSRRLEDIQAFLDPSLDKLASVYELMSNGKDIESAAAAAGLPARQ